MNPTIALKSWIAVAGAGLIVTVLVAQTPPAIHVGPVSAIHAHLTGFHFYSGEPKRAVRVEHYCSHLNSDVLQCVIYDSTEKSARLIGVEYIISEALFRSLPADEKKLWHSHRYKVMAGVLTAPNVSAVAEKELITDFVTTYGKTWTTWQVDRGDALPLGLPKLVMGFTADGQLDSKTIEARNRKLKIDTSAMKAQRADFPTRPIAVGADTWQKGGTFQLSDDLLKQTQAATTGTTAVTSTSSFMPVKIDESFDLIQQRMALAKPAITASHQSFLTGTLRSRRSAGRWRRDDAWQARATRGSRPV